MKTINTGCVRAGSVRKGNVSPCRQNVLDIRVTVFASHESCADEEIHISLKFCLLKLKYTDGSELF